MSEYRRLISYLYTYNNGSKNRNVGFAKVERKNGVIRLWINMKESFMPGESFNVYFFVRRKDKIAGIEMGELATKGGAGEFKSAFREEELAADFEELCGLYIKGTSRDRMFASQWDDGDFSVDKIVLLKDIASEPAPSEPIQSVSEEAFAQEAAMIMPSAASEPAQVSLDAVADSPETATVSKAAQTAVQESASGAAAVQEIPIWKRPIKEEVYVSRNELNAQEYQNTEKETLRIAEERERAEGDGAGSEEGTGEETQPQSQQTRNEIDCFFDGRDPVLVFSEDEIYDCVDITPDDLLRLPGAVQGLRQNSFVNHGYYNFRHLLLGKKDGNILVVGVPGIYNRREKMTANMFGFDKFKFSMRSDVRMNHFGYWYKEF